MIEIKANLGQGVVHRIKIRAKNSHYRSDSEPGFVTVGDVLRGIHKKMHRMIPPGKEYKLWEKYNLAQKAFQKRYDLAAEHRKCGIHDRGMAVVDFLGDNVMFAGLTQGSKPDQWVLQVKKREKKGSGFFKFFKGWGKSKRRVRERRARAPLYPLP